MGNYADPDQTCFSQAFISKKEHRRRIKTFPKWYDVKF